jgi:hypothetical protein
MVRRKLPFRWYWLLETEVVVVLVTGVIIGLILLVPGQPELWVVVGCCVSVATTLVVLPYQDQVYKRLGEDRVRPPMALRVFFWIVHLVELAGVTVYLWGNGVIHIAGSSI